MNVFSNLLATNPGTVWTVLGIVAIVVMIVLIVLIILNHKHKVNRKDPDEGAMEQGEAIEESEDEEDDLPARRAVKTYHISKRKEDGRWQVKAAGSEKALKLFNTQSQAIEYAKKVAGNQEANIMIHKEDGSFRKLKY